MVVFYNFLGSKQKLAKPLQAKFPEHSSRAYVFGGAGSDLFYQDPPHGIEVFNDLNHNVYACFWSLLNKTTEFIQFDHFRIHHRELFNDYARLVDTPPSLPMSEEDKFKRGVAWFYVMRHYFPGDHSNGRAFLKPCKPSSKKLTKPFPNNFHKDLEIFRKRLKHVTIENLDFSEIFKRFKDRIDFFVLDPPYVVQGKRYPFSFTLEDHKRLSKLLHEYTGKFLLTYDDDPLVRELYQDFRVEKIVNVCNVNMVKGKPAKIKEELVIMNYPKDDKWSNPRQKKLVDMF